MAASHCPFEYSAESFKGLPRMIVAAVGLKSNAFKLQGFKSMLE